MEIDKSLPALVFNYKNWQGEVGVRHIIPVKVYYGHTDWHKDDGWLLKAWDLDKSAERTFSIEDILEFYSQES